MTDKERIQQVMTHYNLNNVNFCNKVSLNPATLSNILSEKTNPSLQVLRNIFQAFPEISPVWLFSGEGEMFDTGSSNKVKSQASSGESSSSLFADDSTSSVDMFSAFSSNSNFGDPAQQPTVVSPSQPLTSSLASPPASQVNVSEIVKGVVTQLRKPQRRITEVRIFFDDGTFEAFSS